MTLRLTYNCSEFSEADQALKHPTESSIDDLYYSRASKFCRKFGNSAWSLACVSEENHWICCHQML